MRTSCPSVLGVPREIVLTVSNQYLGSMDKWGKNSLQSPWSSHTNGSPFDRIQPLSGHKAQAPFKPSVSQARHSAIFSQKVCHGNVDLLGSENKTHTHITWVRPHLYKLPLLMRRDTGAFSFALAELQSDGLRRGDGMETELFSNVVPQLVRRRILKVLQRNKTTNDQGQHLGTSRGVRYESLVRLMYHRSVSAQSPTSFTRQTFFYLRWHTIINTIPGCRPCCDRYT